MMRLQVIVIKIVPPRFTKTLKVKSQLEILVRYDGKAAPVERYASAGVNMAVSLETLLLVLGSGVNETWSRRRIIFSELLT